MSRAIRIEAMTDCWLWEGAHYSNGYGVMMVTVHPEGETVRRLMSVHRLSYEAFKGPIPEGMHIDHLCRVRNCYNPEHLEAVTQAENNRRMGLVITHCKRGHE